MAAGVRWRSVAAAAAIAVLLSGSRASTWGYHGHRIVARIAAKNLSPSVRAKIAAILQTAPAGVGAAMADAATWPDAIDKRQTGTEAWHFVDVPITAPFTVAGLCPQHACVVDQIASMAARLQNNRADLQLAAPPVPARSVFSQELAFLIHFVGDVHQPLHAATDGDRGGNCVAVSPPIVHADQSQTTQLHAVWDEDEVLGVMARHGHDEAQTAAALFQQFKNGTVVDQLTVEGWAHEANDAARAQIYQKLALPNHVAPPGQCANGIAPVGIGAAYLSATEATAERQLLHAGIRLSRLLNTICGGSGCRSHSST